MYNSDTHFLSSMKNPPTPLTPGSIPTASRTEVLVSAYRPPIFSPDPQGPVFVNTDKRQMHPFSRTCSIISL